MAFRCCCEEGEKEAGNGRGLKRFQMHWRLPTVVLLSLTPAGYRAGLYIQFPLT